ncbi:MAG: hypothetical protein SGPRY_002259, partial [Prymnesium sp.]
MQLDDSFHTQPRQGPQGGIGVGGGAGRGRGVEGVTYPPPCTNAALQRARDARAAGHAVLPPRPVRTASGGLDDLITPELWQPSPPKTPSPSRRSPSGDGRFPIRSPTRDTISMGDRDRRSQGGRVSPCVGRSDVASVRSDVASLKSDVSAAHNKEWWVEGAAKQPSPQGGSLVRRSPPPLRDDDDIVVESSHVLNQTRKSTGQLGIAKSGGGGDWWILQDPEESTTDEQAMDV